MPLKNEQFPGGSERQTRLRAVVDEHIGFVTRVLRSAGVRPPDLDDEIQRTFIVAARRLEDVEVGSERSFLFQVAQNLAWHAHRTRRRRREVLDEPPPERIETLVTPEFLAERKQMRKMLDDIMASLHESLRTVFTLCEFEGMKLAEIAKVLGVPRGTVASRLRRARAQLREYVATTELADDFGAEAFACPEPMLLRRERASSVQRALLIAGISARASSTTHAKALAVLGLTALREPALSR